MVIIYSLLCLLLSDIYSIFISQLLKKGFLFRPNLPHPFKYQSEEQNILLLTDHLCVSCKMMNRRSFTKMMMPYTVCISFGYTRKHEQVTRKELCGTAFLRTRPVSFANLTKNRNRQTTCLRVICCSLKIDHGIKTNG